MSSSSSTAALSDYSKNLSVWVQVVLVIMLMAWSAPLAAQESSTLLTLELALELAREEQEDFLIVREQLIRARLSRDRAWAAILPTLSASGTYTHADREISINDRVLQRQDSVQGSLSTTITLLRGGAFASIVTANRATEAAELSSRWTENTLAFEVAHAYYAALAAQNLVAAAERLLATAQEHLDAMEARGRAGEVLVIDEGRARLEVLTAQEQLLRAQNTREGSLDYLAFLVGREPPLDRAIQENQPTEPSTQEVDASHLETRSDVRAAGLEVHAARSAVTEAWLDYLPTITMNGTFRSTQNTGWSGDPTSWQVGLSLDWVLYDGGLRRVTRRERLSQLRETRLRLENLDRQARQELRGARRDLETAWATIVTSQEQLQLAQQTRGQVLRRYRAGLSNSLELVEAEDALRRAEISLVARQLELALARLAIYRAAGLDPLGREPER